MKGFVIFSSLIVGLIISATATTSHSSTAPIMEVHGALNASSSIPDPDMQTTAKRSNKKHKKHRSEHESNEERNSDNYEDSERDNDSRYRDSDGGKNRKQKERDSAREDD